MLVAMAILSLMTVLLISALSATQETWARTRERIGQFREARVAFETAGQRIAEATVNPYWGYDDPEFPKTYERQSELHFVCGPSEILLGNERLFSGHSIFFQAPFGFGGTEAGGLGGGTTYDGIENGVNLWGYWVEFNSDAEEEYAMRPEFLNDGATERRSRQRFRLMEYRLPTERIPLFEQDESGIPLLEQVTEREELYQWFSEEGRRVENSNPVAENILVFGLRPRVPGLRPDETSIAPAYLYDSRRFQWSSESTTLTRQTRHQVPPVVDLFLVALEEPSFARFLEQEGEEAAGRIASFVNERFRDAEQLESDLAEVEAYLIDLGIQNRVFETSIAIRAGKWHSE
jgi:uncharacterized protein (TIGR02599 family)